MLSEEEREEIGDELVPPQAASTKLEQSRSSDLLFILGDLGAKYITYIIEGEWLSVSLKNVGICLDDSEVFALSERVRPRTLPLTKV